MHFAKEGIRLLHGRMHECLDLLLAHAALLPAEMLTRSIPGFGHPSVRHQLVHVLATESAWVCGLQLLPIPRLRPEDYPGLDAVAEAQRAVRAQTSQYLDSLSEEELNAELVAVPPEWVGPKRSPAFILLHVITHAFHHKGQIVAMFRTLGYPAPDTDLQRSD